ncbi:MAG TPA: sulfurtransferase TusA family protein [Spirochaetota bacterium]|nr:sulfurtransferase TusA family protein [Spirochaetota bacterium]HPC39581.1 sulfurtransferase TusA family protein [Spirochaetota bacterium]HPL18827.1 sulfurtransferase TusA family protein [Spirochaetota bacterium]HQF09476.1 sulfurtransferase TusA family protein [Spirochaetota bacterium]HQH98159.1 sulfurtransferase TusA family protein [Spirochaetota bacterium]
MSEQVIDARGLSCPQPVVLVRKAISDGRTEFSIIVSSDVARENVLRTLKNSGMKGIVSSNGDDIIIKASR